MNHPMIDQIERTGYPKGYVDHEFSGSDALGNEILAGDKLISFDGKVVLAEVLNVEAIEFLKLLGAEETTQK